MQNFFQIDNFKKIHYQKLEYNKTISIVFLHGLMSDIESKKAKFLKKLCKRLKINLLLFEYSGHGKSSGDFTDFSIKDWIEETKSTVSSLINAKKIIFIGSSMGAWIAINILNYFKKKIIGLITIGAAPDFTEELIWKKLPHQEKKKILNGKIFKLNSNYDNYYPISRKFILEARNYLVLKKKFKLQFPIFLFHGSKDESVPLKYSIKLLKNLISKKIYLNIINEGDHSLSKKNDLFQIEKSIMKIIKNRI